MNIYTDTVAVKKTNRGNKSSEVVSVDMYSLQGIQTTNNIKSLRKDELQSMETI